MFSNKNFDINLKSREIIADAKSIQAYQNKLDESDYKIIKCYEYSLIGLDMPYDINLLHKEREELREQIRRLKEKF